MRIRRDVASVPARSAKETWRAIVDLVTGTDSVDRVQLDAAASIMESLIADEQPAEAPIVFKGAGPRVLIYCRYDEEAVELGLDIDAISSNPTGGDWRVTAPCETEDVDWMNSTLNSRASRISVHAPNDAPADGENDNEKAESVLEIDWGAVQP